MSNTNRLGNAIHVLRREETKEMTYEGFARVLGINKATLSRYENGKISPDINVCGRAALLSLKRGRADLANELLEPFANALDATVFDLRKMIAEREAA